MTICTFLFFFLSLFIIVLKLLIVGVVLSVPDSFIPIKKYTLSGLYDATFSIPVALFPLTLNFFEFINPELLTPTLLIKCVPFGY